VPLPRPEVAMERASGSVKEICWSSLSCLTASSASKRAISSFSRSIFSVSRVVFIVWASDGS
jgi:hypothetical protein